MDKYAADAAEEVEEAEVEAVLVEEAEEVAPKSAAINTTLNSTNWTC